MSYPGFNLNTLVNTVNVNSNNIVTRSGQIISLSGSLVGNPSGVRHIGLSGDGNFSGTIGVTGIGQLTATISSSNAYGFSGLVTISGKEPLFAISGGAFQNRPIIFSGSGGMIAGLIDVGSGIVVSYSPVPSKKLFCKIGATSIFNHYSVANAATGTSFALTFQIPDDFNHIVNLELIGIPSVAGAANNSILTFDTNYGLIGTLNTTFAESVATTFQLSGSGNNLASFPVTGILLNAAKNQIVGLEFTQTQTSGNIRYPGFIFNYR